MKPWPSWLRALCLVTLLAGCRAAPPVPPAPPPAAPTAAEPLALAEPRAASAYHPAADYVPLPLTARVPFYQVKADLSQVAGRNLYPGLTAEQKRLLGRQGLVAAPTGERSPVAVALADRAAGRPLLVTTDAALLAFDAVLDDTWRRVVASNDHALLTALTLTLLERSREQFEQVAGAELKEAARRNVAWLGVGAGLLGLPLNLEPGAARLVAAEQALLTAGQPAASPLFGHRLDYAAAVAGEPSPDERLERCRRAAGWYGLVTFASATIDADGNRRPNRRAVRQLLLLAHALTLQPEAPLRQWEALADTRAFFRGEPGGVPLRAALRLAREAYGPEQALRQYADLPRLKEFTARLEALAPTPAGVVEPPAGWPTGALVSFLPQSAGPEREVLAELLGPGGESAVSGLELLACLGVPRADRWLVYHYKLPLHRPGFGRSYDLLRERLAAAPDRPPGDLVRGSLWATAPLHLPATAGHLQFQQHEAWLDRCLVTALAAWAGRRREPRLTVPGEPAPYPEPLTADRPAIAYVEPAPEVFARLAWLTDAAAAGLATHGLLPAGATGPEPLTRLREWLVFLARLAATELRNETPTPADLARLAEFPDALAWFVDGLDQQRLGPAGPEPIELGPVTAGPGPAARLLVIVPHDGRFHLASGLQATWGERPAGPTSAEEWWGQWRDGLGQPEWTASFVAGEPGAPAAPTAPPVFTAEP